MSEDSSLGILAGVGFGGAWVIASGLYDRAFKRKAALTEDTAKEREGLNQRQTALLDGYLIAKTRAEEDATRDRARRLAVDIENDGLLSQIDTAEEDLRAWKSRARCLKHELENARAIVNQLLAARGAEPIEWFDEELPSISTIRIDNTARTQRYAEWRKNQATLPDRVAAGIASPDVTAAIGQLLIPAEHVDE